MDGDNGEEEGEEGFFATEQHVFGTIGGEGGEGICRCRIIDKFAFLGRLEAESESSIGNRAE